MPPLGLSEFAQIVAADAEVHSAAGVMHLLSGVREEARRVWNSSNPDSSLAVVGIELDLSPHGAAFLAAPTDAGTLQRLKVRRLHQGTLEVLPRDVLSPADSKAVALQPLTPYAWPLRSVHPGQLPAYERLLREILGSRLFQPARGPHMQPPLAVRLQETAAEAVTLIQMEVEVERQPPKKAKAQQLEDEDEEQQQQLPEPPDVGQLLLQPRLGPREVWRATVQVKGDAASRTLSYVPVHLHLTDDSKETVSFGGVAVHAMIGNLTQLVQS